MTALGLSALLQGSAWFAQANSTLADDFAAWAAPVNTAMLIVLFLMQQRRGNQVRDQVKGVRDDVASAHTDIQHAASAAASAAESAATAARVAQDVGGTLRTTRLPGEGDGS